MINDECLELCKKSPPSMFRKIHISELHKFQWQSLIDKLQIRAPILLKVFQVITSHSDSRNELKFGNVHFPAICMAIGILLKERNRQMCGVQKMLSLLLFKSGVQKQVCAKYCSISIIFTHSFTCRHNLDLIMLTCA